MFDMLVKAELEDRGVPRPRSKRKWHAGADPMTEQKVRNAHRTGSGSADRVEICRARMQGVAVQRSEVIRNQIRGVLRPTCGAGRQAHPPRRQDQFDAYESQVKGEGGEATATIDAGGL